MPGIVAVCVVLGAAHAPTQAADKQTLNAADFARAGSPTCGIQEAIDALPADGGVVNIPPGNYCLRRSIALRSRVTLRGAGSTTVLTRGKQAHARLTQPARKGDTSVEVETTAGFRIGDEVGLMDDKMRGWYMAHCIIKQVEARRLVFGEPIVSGHQEGVFTPERNAVVINYFPFIRANAMHWQAPVREVAILDLTFDANLAENPGPWTDFTLAAIHLANVSDAVVRGCVVRGSIADGIGVQGGSDNRVEGCLVENCRGHGFHPGTSLRGAVFANNVGRSNGGDGLYFCAEVTGITVANNLFHHNAGHGIGGLGGGGDRFNVVANNVCRANGSCGIQLTDGRDNVVTGNVCLDNSQRGAGKFSGILIANTTRSVITGNRCGCEDDKPSQRFGIEETGASDTNVITGNLCAGNLQGGLAIVGSGTQTAANAGTLVKPSAP
ncbi:MAG: right-handed parallel beta-helix repeat-containing protein [Verrucomicrobiae bacterium]|nr:right-handed parallel beta-helix repeat-containing protein [Verrucomicrobiae bacterium]